MSKASSFEADLGKFKQETLDEIDFVTRDIARKAFKTLVEYSPYPGKTSRSFRPEGSPFSLGSYVLSHRIGINRASPDPYILIDELVGPMLGAHREALSEIIKKLSRKNKNLHRIVLTNKVPHAYNVEIGQWTIPTAKAPGYYVFTKTLQYLFEHIDSMVKLASAKYSGGRRG